MCIRDSSYTNGDFYSRTSGRTLQPAAWPYPSLSVLPIEEYKNYATAVHGPRYSHRISVTVAKGCTWGCAYCGATEEEGKLDRRRDISEIFDWLARESIDKYECYLHLYAPDLFYDKKWMADFCAEYVKRKSTFSWRGVTTTKTLQDLELVKACGDAGCRELAIGIEHINHKKLRPLKSTLDEIEVASKNCLAAGIKLKGLVMLGYPEQVEEDVEFIGNYLTSLGVTVRFTGYTPLQGLKFMSASDLDSIQLDQYDRRTFYDPVRSKLSADYFFSTISQDDGYIHA